MKNLFTIIALITITTIGHSQYLNTGQKQNFEKSQITVSANASLDIAPDYFTLILKIGEKVNVDEETQMTKSLLMKDIEAKLLKKLKPFDITESDLELFNISETTSGNTVNAYGGYNNNYSSAKKKLIHKEYEIKWDKGLDEMESFVRSLRFNGFESARITPVYSEESMAKLKTELISNAMVKAKDNAKTIAALSNKKIGAVHSVNLQSTALNNVYANQYVNYNYNNQLQSTFYVVGNVVKGKTESIMVSVSYSLE